MIDKLKILDFRNYLTSRFLYKNKLLNIFLIIFYCGLIVLFIASLILVLNYRYNIKTISEQKYEVFLGLLIFASISIFINSFFVFHSIVFVVVTNYVILKTNNYKYLKENKQIYYSWFAYTFYFYDKKYKSGTNNKEFYQSLVTCQQLGGF